MNSKVALVSFHSTSKGVTGECGRRGGYFELENVSEEVRSQIYKMASVGLCPPVPGQVAVDCMVRHPREGDPSYPLWKKETDAIQAACTVMMSLAQEVRATVRLHSPALSSCTPLLRIDILVDDLVILASIKCGVLHKKRLGVQ